MFFVLFNFFLFLKFYFSSPRHRDLSRDSLCSDSTHRSSLSLSRSHSQSSFTSLERLEIRHLIKTLKTKGIQSLNNPIQLSPISPPLFEQILPKQSSSIPIIKPKKSSITEELDREFNKLRSINPNEDLLLVKPSLIHKEKKSFPPLPTFDELLHKISDVSSFSFHISFFSMNLFLDINIKTNR
jgi:hypothetical protein